MSIDDLGFTPVPEHVARMHGAKAAYVWGMIWRYCRVKGCCDVPLAQLAKECKMSRRTLARHIKTLHNSGFITDRTPNKRNAPRELVVSVDDLEARNWDV